MHRVMDTLLALIWFW